MYMQNLIKRQIIWGVEVSWTQGLLWLWRLRYTTFLHVGVFATLEALQTLSFMVLWRTHDISMIKSLATPD